ncbi:unnamed protein product [Rotaria sordida]|uniref:Uncharacterized protein n=1 Tax=Rotaria sordida TaxID=392033 RepID=A0A819QKV8_9BILA|nr:unnamed protein product [Rotaria sordida]
MSNQEGITPCPDKIIAINDISVPNNIKAATLLIRLNHKLAPKYVCSYQIVQQLNNSTHRLQCLLLSNNVVLLLSLSLFDLLKLTKWNIEIDNSDDADVSFVRLASCL